MKDLKGKVALVTGAAMGMGRSLSEDILKEGCRVALVDVNQTELANTRKELSKIGKCADYICDISDRQAVYQLAKQVEKEFGPVDILVNNAGIVKAQELVDLSDDAVEKMISINLTAQFWTCKAFLSSMIKKGQGHIVNFASAGGILALPNLSAYCASKFGVVGFSDSLRQEMKKHKYNIGVIYVCPNTVNTGMFDGSKMVTGTKMLAASDVAKRVIKAIKNNKAMVCVLILMALAATGINIFQKGGAYNSGTVQSMRDEIRKINDNLFLGLGYMALGGGKINPAPFALIGPAKDWVGVDQP